MKKVLVTSIFVFFIAIFVFVNASAKEIKEKDMVIKPILQNEKSNNVITVETIRVPEGTIRIERIENELSEYQVIGDVAYGKSTLGIQSSLMQLTQFTSYLNATCNSGAKFVFSTTGPGPVGYRLNWSSGYYQNNSNCSGGQCTFTISTSWSAHYTNAFAQVWHPQTVWGSNNAYQCK